MSVFPNTKTIIDLCTSLGAYKYHDFVSEATSLYMFLHPYTVHDTCTRQPKCIQLPWCWFQNRNHIRFMHGGSVCKYSVIWLPNQTHSIFVHQASSSSPASSFSSSASPASPSSQSPSPSHSYMPPKQYHYIYIFMHRALVHKTIMVCWQSKTMIDLWIKPQCIKLPWLCWHKQKPW